MDSEILWETKYIKKRLRAALVIFSCVIFLFLIILLATIFLPQLYFFTTTFQFNFINMWPLEVILLIGAIIVALGLISWHRYSLKTVIIKIKLDCIEVWDKNNISLKQKCELGYIDKIEIVFIVLHQGTVPDFIRFTIQDKSGNHYTYFINCTLLENSISITSLIKTINRLNFYNFPEEKTYWYRRLKPGEQKPNTVENFLSTIDQAALSEKSFLKRNFLKILKTYFSKY
ncbi:hypothetical protein KJ853_04400 [Patescibacteria group bacterium]|nr:hypothetical protein [Patescibacteria group bacterium]